MSNIEKDCATAMESLMNLYLSDDAEVKEKAEHAFSIVQEIMNSTTETKAEDVINETKTEHNHIVQTNPAATRFEDESFTASIFFMSVILSSDSSAEVKKKAQLAIEFVHRY